MSTPLRIHEMRVALIYWDTFLDLLLPDAPMRPFAFLGSADAYAARFDALRAAQQQRQAEFERRDRALAQTLGNDARALAAAREQLRVESLAVINDPATLTPPWPELRRNYKHHFWQGYLTNEFGESGQPNYLTGDEAWKYLVPFRSNAPFKASPRPDKNDARPPKTLFMADSFFYPHGIALVIMGRVIFHNDGVSPARAAERVISIRQENLDVTLANGEQAFLTLDNLASTLLDELVRGVLGAHSARRNRPGSPLTVVTFIQGAGELATRVAPDSDLHRILHGLAAWNPDLAGFQNLPDPRQNNLLICDPAPEHWVYGLPRSRVAWMPQNFLAVSRRQRHKLSCYHRNLTLVWTQTALLAQIAEWHARLAERAMEIPAELRRVAKNAAPLLAELYAARRDGDLRFTYNSATPRRYIQDHQLETKINAMRHAVGMEQPLSYVQRRGDNSFD